MVFETDAIYENGVLKLNERPPLDEHQRVHVLVHEVPGSGDQAAKWWKALEVAEQSERGFT